jgi:hypothetical protein
MKHIPINDRQLPFRLTAQSKGVQKAYANFISEYGLTAGRRIFLAKADERGVGNTLRQKVDSVFTTGRKVKKPQKGA